jgi:hypothetical protein
MHWSETNIISSSLLVPQDLVGMHLDMAAQQGREAGSEDIGILLLGDSSDRNLIFDFCQAAGRGVRPSMPSS